MNKISKYKSDLFIVVVVFLFIAISILSIYSASCLSANVPSSAPIKQALWYGVGIILIFVIMSIGTDFFYKYAYIFYIICIISLVLLLLFAKPISNSKCWFVIPGIGSIQPSEFMKISLIIVFSRIVNDFNKSSTHNLKDEIIFIFKMITILLIPSILTFMQPDTGAVIMYFVIFLSMIIPSGIRIRWYIISIILIIILGITFFYLYLNKTNIFINIFGSNFFYRMDRLFDWKRGSGMQLENASIAVGSSGILGHGYLKTPIYFPESHTDFIFAIIASNFGIVGSIILIFLFFIFDVRIISIGMNSYDNISKYTIFGIVGLLIFQQVQNIGMNIGLLPIMGITLPFISYGGSSLLSYMFIIGLVLTIKNNRLRARKSSY